MIVPIKYMPKISAVGLLCLDKFENNQTRTCTTFFRTSNVTEPYFKQRYFLFKIEMSYFLFQKPMSLTSDDGSSTRTTPSPVPLNRSDSDRTDWDGLNLSLTAREMRERIGSKKKTDPRRDKLDMRKKYEIIQTL